MKKTDDIELQPDRIRRAVLQALIAAPMLGLIGGRDAASEALATSAAAPSWLAPTPPCGDGDDDDLTPAQTEGPYFKPSSPERVSLLETGLPGTRLIVAGQVVSTACAPIRGALLDFWQADANGQYDLKGFRLRGHQFADSSGRFRLETIVPGLYPGRTRHIHVRVQAPKGRILTTQLYFPAEPGNARDGIFSSALVMDLTDAGRERLGTFNFVLRT